MTTTMIKDPKAPATLSQLSYLASLVAKRDLPDVCERYTLVNGLGAVTKGQASEWIDALLKAPIKTQPAVKTPAQVYAEQAASIAQAFDAPIAPAAPVLTEVPTWGYYLAEDGTLYYWDVTGKDAYPQLRKLVTSVSYSGQKKGSWKKVYGGYKGVKVTATWIPYGGKAYVQTEKTALITVPTALVDIVTGGTSPLTQDAAAQLGKQFGFCVRCGATLTDPVSVANGIGPVCKTYWG